MMHFLLGPEVPLYQEPDKETPLSRSLIWRLHQRFERGFDYFQEKYKAGLIWSLSHRALTLAAFAVVSLGSLALIREVEYLRFCTSIRGRCSSTCVRRQARGLKQRTRCSGAELRTSAALAHEGANAVPNAPTPLLPVAQTVAQTGKPANPPGWQIVPVAATSLQNGIGEQS